MSAGFRTVGHSSRSLDQFVEILKQAGVEVVADVRSFPRSRSNPAFNIDSLPGQLQLHQIGYRHFPDLGGRRPKQPGIPEAVNAFWRHPSFHNYADYALSDPFARAFAELVALGHRQRIAIMCSEAVWWRCHRRIITDYLLLQGDDVLHLMTAGREDPASPTPGAERTAEGKVVYPAKAGGDGAA